jgi:hypothetical protein
MEAVPLCIMMVTGVATTPSRPCLGLSAALALAEPPVSPTTPPLLALESSAQLGRKAQAMADGYNSYLSGCLGLSALRPPGPRTAASCSDKEEDDPWNNLSSHDKCDYSYLLAMNHDHRLNSYSPD